MFSLQLFLRLTPFTDMQCDSVFVPTCWFCWTYISPWDCVYFCLSGCPAVTDDIWLNGWIWMLLSLSTKSFSVFIWKKSFGDLLVLSRCFEFIPQHFLDRGLQQRHAGHIRRRRYPPITTQHAQHLCSERGLHLWVTGQLVQRPGHGAGDLGKHAGARGQINLTDLAAPSEERWGTTGPFLPYRLQQEAARWRCCRRSSWGGQFGTGSRSGSDPAPSLRERSSPPRLSFAGQCDPSLKAQRLQGCYQLNVRMMMSYYNKCFC